MGQQAVAPEGVLEVSATELLQVTRAHGVHLPFTLADPDLRAEGLPGEPHPETDWLGAALLDLAAAPVHTHHEVEWHGECRGSWSAVWGGIVARTAGSPLASTVLGPAAGQRVLSTVEVGTHDAERWWVARRSLPAWAASLADHLTGAVRDVQQAAVEPDGPPGTGTSGTSGTAAGRGPASGLPSRVLLPADLMVAAGQAFANRRPDLVAELVRTEDPIRIWQPASGTGAPARWGIAAPTVAVDLLRRLHCEARGHFRFRVQAGDGAQATGVALGWLLHEDGWREMSGAGQGRAALRRIRPVVLRDRLVSVFAGGAA